MPDPVARLPMMANAKKAGFLNYINIFIYAKAWFIVPI
jgi:hypothetical protein